MIRILPSLFLILLIVLASFVVTPHLLAGNIIRINGSGTALDMLKPIMEAYRKDHRDAVFQMERPLGSSGAIKALTAGAIDIAAVSRALKPEEIAQGIKLKSFGKTPLAIVTEKKVPLKTISTGELENIYSGKTINWPNGEAIRVILRPKEDADTKILASFSPGMAQAISKARQRRGVMIAVTDPESNEAVSRTIGGIGTSGLTNVIVEKIPLNVLALNGVPPSRQNLASAIYPLSKDISFVTTGKLSDTAADFLEFIYSKRGKALAEKAGVLITADNP